MKTFRDHVNQKNIDIVASQIVEHLALQSEFFDPFDTLESVFVESYGQENAFLFAEAFEDERGRWGNIGNAFRGAGNALVGGASRAGGGLAGGGLGSMIGAAKGMFGYSLRAPLMISAKPLNEVDTSVLSSIFCASGPMNTLP